MQIVKFPVKVKLKKFSDLIFFSQLDLIHLLARALRRTNLPIYFTQGFHPRVKISFLSGLKLGVEGQMDVVFYFREKIQPQDMVRELSPQLPKGLEIVEILS
tara:strand:- start:876 stop:1181 length:306 start_codon:yes stop_codon:yes gene_type:complete